jgi:predicted HTH transcriptional regulator
LQALIGKPEDAEFDCKEWPARQDDARRIIAKAACGFTNAMGGVIVIGLKASGAGANTSDVVRGLAPVADRHAVASASLDIILQSVEPGSRNRTRGTSLASSSRI